MTHRGLELQIWRQATGSDYESLLDSFKEFSDATYLAFNQRVTPNLGKSYGIRVPILRRILQALKRNPQAEAVWERLCVGDSFEERMLAGMILPELDPGFAPTYQRILRFLPKITNWALCDTTAGALKAWANRHESELWEVLPEFLRSQDPWRRRLGVVLLLHFQTPSYLEKAEKLIALLGDEREYYVLMAIGWIMSCYFFVAPDAVIAWLQDYPNDEAVNLTIRKIGESRKGSPELRTSVKKFKR